MTTTPSQSIELIAAVASNHVIGNRGQLPWRLPDDLKHFKTLTTGHPVIMGRRTYESIERPLPNRHNIVVTTTWTTPPAPGVDIAPTLDRALQLAGPGQIFIVGGGVLYSAALPIAHLLHLTELDTPADGDAHFPDFDHSQWRIISEQRHDADARHAVGFYFRTYQRI
ncbi:MAG TPA: dihydrofolate reductase [Tepidisphaeraceae bacterium]|jgi:dihydrofolate reductase|nr:dihydrofolate reductase [Tepidisphaeraceae bacterium]